MADPEDVETDEPNPALEPMPDVTPKSAKAWLALIKRGQKAFETWQTKSDNIDRLYANLEKLSNTVRDREFQIFWANLQVLAPSIYSRPPVPVVVPAFRDQRPLQRTASEMLERCTVTGFRLEDIDSVMRLVRDDLVRLNRGVAWLRYSTEYAGQRVCIDHTSRKDFVHDPARKWKEVDWVAKRSWLTKPQARKRFRAISGNEYQNATYAVRKDDDDLESDGQLKAGFWELWSKSGNKVVWVADGCDKLLDEGKPHLELENFFPCPRPAYGTLQPESLLPIPDVLFYKDQLEEINEVTARIAALTQSLKLKGFYPQGAGEIGDAIEAAIKNKSDNAVLVPISNWAMLGGAAAKDTIVWLPIEMVAETITSLITVRKQLIDDVYQITGLSDIMRGETDAQETAAAQQLKSQYGSIRVHDKQAELVRFARDITALSAEILAENFTGQTLLDMSQMQVPTNAEVARQVAPVKKELAQLGKDIQDAQSDPEVQQIAKAKPDLAKQVLGQAQQKAQALQAQLEQLDAAVTLEQIVAFLRDNRTRPFALDIETDSTIEPDEAAQQARATMFVKEVGGYLAQAVPLVEQVPQIAPVVSALLKFTASQFRVGREIEGVIDKFADQMVPLANQPKGPTPAMQKAAADAQALQQQNTLDTMRLQLEGKNQQLQAQLDGAKVQIEQGKLQLADAKLKLDQAIAQSDALIAHGKNTNDAVKHASIEETKRQGQALAVLGEIKVAEINKGVATDKMILDASLERIADVGQHAHEQQMQAVDHAHELEMQDTANAAAAVSQESAQQATADQAAQQEGGQ